MSVHAGCLPDEALVNGLLDVAAGRPAREVADHRAVCAQCDARAVAWEATLQLLTADPLSVAPPVPAGLHESIMDAVKRSPAVGADPLADGAQPSGSMVQRFRNLFTRPAGHAWAGVAAALGLVVVSIVGLNGPLRPDRVTSIGDDPGRSDSALSRIVDGGDSTDDALLDLSFSTDADAEVALEEASSLSSEQTDWVIRELGRRLGG